MEPDGPSKKENHKESCQAADVLNTRSASSVVTRGPYSCSHKMEGFVGFLGGSSPGSKDGLSCPYLPLLPPNLFLSLYHLICATRDIYGLTRQTWFSKRSHMYWSTHSEQKLS